MVISPKLKVYATVLGIFVLGAGAGGATGYAVASKKLADVLGGDRLAMGEARRMEALAHRLDLTSEQRRKVRGILERHRGEYRDLTEAMLDKCGDDLRDLRTRVDGEIRAVLEPDQARRFGEMMEKRGRRFPLGPGPHRRHNEP
jgi:Spy/CpxP family protein refolding chaperone